MYRGEEFISFEAAVGILQTELKFPEHRALHFVKRFDHNNDGRLSAEEFNEFRRKVEETCVRIWFLFSSIFQSVSSGYNSRKVRVFHTQLLFTRNR